MEAGNGKQKIPKGNGLRPHCPRSRTLSARGGTHRPRRLQVGGLYQTNAPVD